MKVGTGNEKLGRKVKTISREVGPTCPSSCPFLNNGCYAERIQRRRPNVLSAWRSNNDPVWSDVEKQVQGRLVRLHVGGDFMNPRDQDQIDRAYLARLILLARRVEAKDKWWTYTHAWKEVAPHLKYLEAAGIATYASVHTEEEQREAERLGFKIALCVDARKGEHTGKYWPGAKAITCPEQIGTKASCEDCKYCTEGRGNVVFLNH
jgi:hypothetical protein